MGGRGKRREGHGHGWHYRYMMGRGGVEGDRVGLRIKF